MSWSDTLLRQLMLRSDTRYFSEGTIIADSHEQAKALMVVTSGLVRSSAYAKSQHSGCRVWGAQRGLGQVRFAKLGTVGPHALE